jgi:hypothetical protein
MLKIQRTANGYVVFAVSGRLQAVTLDLKDLVLVDRDSVGFLRACAQKGIELRNCPQYIRTWMACDEEGA